MEIVVILFFSMFLYLHAVRNVVTSDSDEVIFSLPFMLDKHPFEFKLRTNEYLDESKTDEAIERERERQRVLDTKIDRSNMDE